MPARTYWKGYLKLSLVTCPVAMTPATSEGEKVRFHTLNRDTGNRVVSRYVDAESGKPVDPEDQAKGYEAASGRFVVIEDDELEAVRLDTVHTIDINKFVPKDSIPWVYLDSPHYLVPDDDVAIEAFSVIRDAMAAAKMVGMSKVVLYRRERAVMLEPRDRGIVLWTLRYGDEVRDEKAYFADIENSKPAADLLALAQKFIEAKSEDWSPKMVKDPVQEHLLKLIASKKRQKGARVSAAREDGRPANVVNLFDALKKSLQSDKSLRG